MKIANKPAAITATPWGAPDSVEWVGGDRPYSVAFVSTPSHGGYYVAADQLNRIPLAWRKASFNGQGLCGWFEEDCDWAMVALVFKNCFGPEEIAIARKIAKAWLEPKLYRGALDGY